jgi:ABC-type uncharacterized transport system involved in gliding motility auxiliary subunit
MKNLQRILKYMVWPGLVLVTAGLVVGLLNGWTVVAVALLVAGLMLLVAGVAAGDPGTSRVSFWQRRSTQAGTNAAVSVLSVLVIIGLINFVAARYNSRTDFTEGQQLTLSPASQTVVRELDQPTEVVIFSQVPNPADQQLLDNYRRVDRKFSYRFLDPYADPQLAQQYGVESGGEVFVSAGDRKLLVQQVNQQEALSERQLTNKLAQLSQENVAVVYFLQGHEEYAIDGSEPGFLQAATRLQDESYTVAPLNLADTGRVPTDADVLVIAGPRKKLFDAEASAIKDYLNGGGSVFALIDPQTTTGLEALLSEWGIVLENTIVIDTSGGGQLAGLGPAAPLVTDYGEHPITEAFGNGRSFFPVARPLQIRESGDIQATPLLFSNQNSHAQPVTEGELSVDTNQAPAGPFALGAALSQATEVSDRPATPTPEEQLAGAEDQSAEDQSAEEPAATASESRMVVIGNSGFATDGLFDQQLNGDVFLNAVSWLSKIDSPVLSIRPKETTNRRINMTVTQQIWLMLLALVVFPLSGLLGAGILWARRR